MPVKGSRKPRVCHCGEIDPTQFYVAQASECKKCLIERTASHQRGNTELHRRRHLKRAYGWTPEKYDAELAKQHGLCALCGKPPIVGEVLRVDHNHETGETRELIHQHCNSLLGFAREDTAILMAAINYVVRHRQVSD
jgi:recombination endonuclease VII